MGRIYTLSGENLSLGTGYVLAALQTAAAGNAGSIVAIHMVEATQNATPTSAQVRLACGQRNTSGTLTVTSATPAPHVLGGPASGISGGTSPLTAAKSGVNSSADSGGTYTAVKQVNLNNQGGYIWLPPPEHRIIVAPSTVFAVWFIAAPGTTTGWTIEVTFEELY